MGLTSTDINEFVTLWRDLHRHPEVSSEEVETAQRIANALSSFAPSPH